MKSAVLQNRYQTTSLWPSSLSISVAMTTAAWLVTSALMTSFVFTKTVLSQGQSVTYTVICVWYL